MSAVNLNQHISVSCLSFCCVVEGA